MVEVREDGFVILTKRVRIPQDKIVGVRPSRDGIGCLVETDRGITVVTESYDEVVSSIYGDGGFYANIGNSIV